MVINERVQHSSNSDFTFVGSGNIGEKARQLFEKTPKLREIGFQVPHRTVLAEGFFDGFFQRNGIARSLREAVSDPDVYERVLRGSFSSDDFDTLVKIGLLHGATPLMVRSSAEGDARGTGTYASELTENKPGIVRKGVQRVLASYFSESAVDFRRDAQTGEGFGIMIEPVVGIKQTKTYEDTDFSIDFYAPTLSGFGYTSTLKADGYISAVPGLGGGVDNKDGLKITKSGLDESNGYLAQYIRDYRDLQRWTDPWERDMPNLLRREATGKTYAYPDKYHRRASTYYRDMDLRGDEDFQRLNMLPLFEMMGQMEHAFGTPQYFEWAMTLENSAAKYWILQIADVNKKSDHMEFEDYGDVLLMAHTVTGTGIKDIPKIANCWNPDDVNGLHEFNKRNKDYALLYSSRLTTSFGAGRFRKLQYADFSNASVFLEIQDAQHVGSPVAHLGGQLDVTGKLFGVVDYEAEVPPNWDEFRAGRKKEEGIEVYQGKLKVVASEKQDKLIVYKQDSPTAEQ